MLANAFQDVWMVAQKVFNRKVSFGRVATPARRGEVRHLIVATV
jgi:hypothetical protein